MWSEFDSEGKKVCTKCGVNKPKHCQAADNLARYHKKQAKNPDTKKNRDKTEFGNFNKYLTMRFTQ
jgi:hypothetical protein